MLALMLACSAPELPDAAAEMPTTRFHTGGAGAPMRLREMLGGAVITLPETNLPASTLPGQFQLDHWSADGEHQVHDYPLPTRTKKKHSRAPAGVSLLLAGRAVPYGPRGWRLVDGEIRLKREGEPVSAVLSSSTLSARAKRLDVAEAGLEHGAYVDHEITLQTDDGQVTRPGLLIPAPGSISWTIDVPEGAELSMSTVIAPLGLEDEPCDGALLLVEVDGETVARFSVDEDSDDHVVDLSPWAGTTVGLVLRSDPDGASDWDYVFVGEPLLYGERAGPPRRVVVIGIDTLRTDELTQQGYAKDVTAALDDFASSAVLFDNAWAPAPRTRPSFRTSTTGHYPLAAIPAPTLGELFQEAGFTTAGITANVHLVPKHGFNDGFDFWQFDNSVDANVQVDRAKAWLEPNKDRDSLLFLHLMDPHNFYKAPGLWANKYVEHKKGLSFDLNRWQILRMGGLTADNKAWLRERYDGEVAWMADQLSGFLAYVLALPGDTVVAIHSDHGEEFWDHGSYEHNHTLYDEVTRAALWVRTPEGWGGGPHHVEAPVGLHDLAPTLYDLAGLQADTDGVSLRPYLDAGAAAELSDLDAHLHDRPLQLGHLMYDQELWGAVADGHKCTLRTSDGQLEVYDLGSDPGETVNLASNEELARRCVARIGEAAGFPSGDGLRVRIRKPAPFTLVFESPVSAVVMDPEAARTQRANIEWGDFPDIWPEDIGQVKLSEDGLRLSFEPGSHGKGTLLVLSPAEPVAIEGDHSAISVIEPGPVLLIQDSVRDRLAEDARGDLGAAHDPAAIETLQILGYLEGD